MTPWKFSGHKFCGRGDTFVIYHVISRDHMIRGSYDLSDESMSPLVTSLPNLLLIVVVEEDIERIWFIKWYHMIIWWRVIWLCRWQSLILCHCCDKFDGYRSCGSTCFYFVTWHHVTIWSRGRVTWQVGAPEPKSPVCPIW